jgi:hypothetical protein
MGGGSPTSRSTGRSTPRPSELSRAFIALGGGAVVVFVASFESVHVGGVALVLMTVVVAASWLAMARERSSEAIVLVLAFAASLPFVNR